MAKARATSGRVPAGATSVNEAGAQAHRPARRLAVSWLDDDQRHRRQQDGKLECEPIQADELRRADREDGQSASAGDGGRSWTEMKSRAMPCSPSTRSQPLVAMREEAPEHRRQGEGRARPAEAERGVDDVEFGTAGVDAVKKPLLAPAPERQVRLVPGFEPPGPHLVASVTGEQREASWRRDRARLAPAPCPKNSRTGLRDCGAAAAAAARAVTPPPASACLRDSLVTAGAPGSGGRSRTGAARGAPALRKHTSRLGCALRRCACPRRNWLSSARLSSWSPRRASP